MSVQSVQPTAPISSTYSTGTSTKESLKESLKSDHSASGELKSGKEARKLSEKGIPLSIGEEQLVRAIDHVIKSLEGPSTRFEMKYHKPTHSIVVKVLNKETGELIREIPPEKTLDLVTKMMEFAGILIDEKV